MSIFNALDYMAPVPPPYLLYCFDAEGRRLPPERIDATDDLMAIAVVRLQGHKRCELWHADRMVLGIPEMRTRA